MFQKMSTKFALDFISLNRPDSTPAVSYDNHVMKPIILHYSRGWGLQVW